MNGVSNIAIDSIKVGERIRDEMGDIQGLADSIQKFGLLHPIIIDENQNLIAGHRRLQAVIMLGWNQIETRLKNQLSEKEKRILELEENTKRKDLTELEKSKNLLELVETAKQILKEGFPSPSDEKQKMENGRPSIPDSREKVAGMIGISTGAITEAKQHVQAVEKYPELTALPKKEAIQAAKEPEKIQQYKQAIEDFPQLQNITLGLNGKIKAAENLRQMPEHERQKRFEMAKEVEEKGKSEFKQIDDEYKEMKKIRDLIMRSFEMKGIVTPDRVECWFKHCLDRGTIESAIDDVQRGIDELSKLQTMLQERLKGPRRVVI